MEDNKMEKFFTDIIEDALKSNSMMMVYIIFTSFISADNNRTKKQIKENCESLIELIKVLERYPNNEELQKLKEKAIKYNEKYYKF